MIRARATWTAAPARSIPARPVSMAAENQSLQPEAPGDATLLISPPRFGFPSLAAAVLATLLAAVPAQAEGSARALYEVSFAGFRIARGSLAVTVSGTDYAARVQISTSGIADLVAGEESVASSAGRLRGGRVAPNSYNLFSQGEQTTQVAMVLSSGDVSSLQASPPLSEQPDRVPVTEAHQRDITDPLSATILPVEGDLEDGCDRTLPIFDGWTRYDITFFFKEMQSVEVDGYSGPAVVCSARWVPIAGHREGRESTRFMAENRDIEGWFIPAGELGVLVPYRIELQTMRGRLVVAATRFETEGSASN